MRLKEEVNLKSFLHFYFFNMNMSLDIAAIKTKLCTGVKNIHLRFFKLCLSFHFMSKISGNFWSFFEINKTKTMT